MASRRNVSKKTRFEVFKRDKFTCQYCGRSSPDVVLNCDHIDPVANGGGNEILNLITSCEACNAGKKDRLLDDSAAVKLQVDQLKQLEERRQQLEMLMQWKNELLSVDKKSVELLSEFWSRLTADTLCLSDHGKLALEKLLSTYAASEIADAMKASVGTYVCEGSKEEFDTAFDALPRVLHVNKAEQEKPGTKDLYYIRGIVRSKLKRTYIDEHKCLRLITDAYESGVSMQDIRDAAKSYYSSWHSFACKIQQLMEEASYE